jgi:hypothetical protein
MRSDRAPALAALLQAAALGVVLAAATALPAAAQTIEAGDLPCLPIGGHAAVTAHIDPPLAEGWTARVYFRRLSLEVEDFYWTPMVADQDRPGGYWGVLPLPVNARFPRERLKNASTDRWAAWWKAKEASEDRNPNGDLDQAVIRERAGQGKLEKRAWMGAEGDATLEQFLAAQKTEPAEWFVAVLDPSGKITAATDLAVAEVRDDCKAPLTREQQDLSDELTVGETAEWQKGEGVFHWECEDISHRVDWQGDTRRQGPCVPVVIAWWPVAPALGVIGLVTVIDQGPPSPHEVSPSRP